ncbi:GNAT family N-acetyltransferase [Candidatus Peregrinibacteria bacterium]|nr:GNAT family N-acetyltransferase [Candidatus Peregrinibacteria bacterium]
MNTHVTFPSSKGPLTGDHIFLRELREEDATEAYASWLNDPEVNRYLETRQVTLEQLRSYIREKAASPDALLFGIFWKENGRHIGNIKLEPIDREAHEATMGILIGDKEYWGKGIATEATNLISDYAFSLLHLRSITLGVIADHAAAIRVYEKCGFARVRVEKGAINHDGVLFDKLVMRREAP